MKIKLTNVYLSYPHLWEAAQVENQGDFNFSASILIDKTDKKNLKAIKDAIAEAKQGIPEACKKKGKTFSAALPYAEGLKDGSEKENEEYRDRMFLNAKRKDAKGRPLIIGPDRLPITEDKKNSIYAGCIVNVVLSVYPYYFTGKTGVGFGLEGIQLVREFENWGEGGGCSADDFEAIDTEDIPF